MAFLANFVHFQGGFPDYVFFELTSFNFRTDPRKSTNENKPITRNPYSGTCRYIGLFHNYLRLCYSSAVHSLNALNSVLYSSTYFTLPK